MSIDPKIPLITVNKSDKGYFEAAVYGGIAWWPKINQPEPDLDDNKNQKVKMDWKTKRPVLGPDGNPIPLWKWGVLVLVPKDTQGIKLLQDACTEIRTVELRSAGKIVVLKDGDLLAQQNIADGKDPEYQEAFRNRWVININMSAPKDKPPVVHNEVYMGAIVAAKFGLGAYGKEPGSVNKGVKGYLREIGRVAPGERVQFGNRGPSLEVAFEPDATPSSAPAASSTASSGDDGKDPWEA